MGRFVEVCGKRSLKINTDKRKVMLLVREEGLQSEVCIDGIRLEHVSEFNFFGMCFGRVRYR